MRLKTFDIKSVEGAGGGITAYASTFDREPDSYGDVVAKGAFADTLRVWRDSGRPIPLLFAHNMDEAGGCHVPVNVFAPASDRFCVFPPVGARVFYRSAPSHPRER